MRDKARVGGNLGYVNECFDWKKTKDIIEGRKERTKKTFPLVHHFFSAFFFEPLPERCLWNIAVCWTDRQTDRQKDGNFCKYPKGNLNLPRLQVTQGQKGDLVFIERKLFLSVSVLVWEMYIICSVSTPELLGFLSSFFRYCLRIAVCSDSFWLITCRCLHIRYRTDSYLELPGFAEVRYRTNYAACHRQRLSQDPGMRGCKILRSLPKSTSWKSWTVAFAIAYSCGSRLYPGVSFLMIYG